MKTLRWAAPILGYIYLMLAPIPAAAQDAGETVIYRGATVIDVNRGVALPGAAVVVQGERIMDLIPNDAPHEGREVDASGLYVIPGLIDAHVHLATPPDAEDARRTLRRQVYGGVTAVRGMADDVRSVAELSRQALTGEIPAPDIHYAALVAGPSFFEDPRTAAAARGYPPGGAPWMQAIEADTDLPLAVAMARGTGASGLKIYANLPAERVTAVTAEAHRQGLPVWAHSMVYPATPQEVLAARPDVMSHICTFAHQAQSPDQRPGSYHARTTIDAAPFLNGDDPVMQGLFEGVAAAGVVVDPTVRVYVEHARRHAERPQGSAPLCTPDMAYALTRQAWRAGVVIAAGTDGETPPDAAWPALHEELDLLANAVGMPPSDVLRAATVNGARAMGQQDQMGAVAPGMLANLVFLDADPLQDVAALRSVVFTLKRGVRLDRDDYLTETPES